MTAYSLKGKRSFAVLNAMVISATKTLSTTSFASGRTAYHKAIVNYAGNVTISNGGYLAASRGEMNIAAGSTLKDGFFYGAQGKVICPGTLSQTSALRVAGVMAQLDCGAGTITAGQVSALWADVSGADPTSTWDAETNIIRATNSTGKNVHAQIFTHGKADYFADINSNTSNFVAAGAATPSNAMKKIKVLVDGVELYILAAETWS